MNDAETIFSAPIMLGRFAGSQGILATTGMPGAASGQK